MNEKEKNNRRYLLILQALLIGVIAFVFCYYDILYPLESLYRDKVYQQSRGVNQSIKIIAVDEKALNTYGPFGTWDRSVYADVLNALGDYPSVVGFDFHFSGQMSEEGDAILKEAAMERGNVVFASHIDFDTVAERDEDGKLVLNQLYVNAMELPFSEEEVAYGYVNVFADSDGAVRRAMPTFTNTQTGETYTGFAYRVYQLYCEKKGIAPTAPKVDSTGSMWIYYAGKPFDYEAISLSDLLDGKIDPRVFTDCIVLVGAYANGLQDQFSVPNSGTEMFGVEINANILQAYTDGAFPVPADRVFISILTALIAFALFLLFSKMGLKWGTPLFVVLEVFYVFLGIILFTKADIILPGVYMLILIFLDYLFALILKYISESIQKRKIASAFRKYVAPQVVDGIMKSGQYKIALGGETRDIAVLFVDIRGFTPLSESLKPEQVVEILNEYLNLTTNSIFKNGGTLDKFIGDATMAVFNAPFDLDDYELRALRTAKDIVAGAKALEKSCMDRFGRKVTFGVGVNCGEAVVGNIGCDFRMDYTAIGDTVNTAARLESNAKPGQVLISETIYERVKDKGVKVEPIGEIPLKGKSKGVFVYQLTEIDGVKVGGEE
ncbi:MAG: adenylate/guanylate cyclase domain-containing protein [Lachnospiraceae bacterium]|nr:adenylate/guanylate cyclase domain-containing protein [Lachnospiraceae bacterium]